MTGHYLTPDSSERVGIDWQASGGNERPCQKVGRAIMAWYVFCAAAIGLAVLEGLRRGVGQAFDPSLNSQEFGRPAAEFSHQMTGLQEVIDHPATNHQTSDVSR